MQRESVLYYNNFWYFFGTNGSPPLSLSSPTIRFLIFCYCVEISCLELSLSLSKTLLSLVCSRARACVPTPFFYFFFCCVCVCVWSVFCSKLKPPLERLSRSLSLGRSCCLRTTTTRTATTERRRRREKKTASWGWCWRGDSWCTWSRGSLKFGGQQYKSKMFLSYFSRFVLLLRRYSRYAFALGATAIAIGAIVFNTNRRIE